MANGVVKGSVTKFAGSFGGKLRDKIKTNITSGEFNGFDFDFDFKGASLEDFVSQVELDISSYNFPYPYETAYFRHSSSRIFL